MTVTAEWVRAAMMPRPTSEGHDPPDKSSGEWVTHHELVGCGVTYRQVDYWTSCGLLECTTPNPGSGRQRRYPRTEVAVVAVMARLTAAGIPPGVAAVAARGDGWIAPGIRIAVDLSLPAGRRPLHLIEEPAEAVPFE